MTIIGYEVDLTLVQLIDPSDHVTEDTLEPYWYRHCYLTLSLVHSHFFVDGHQPFYLL